LIYWHFLTKDIIRFLRDKLLSFICCCPFILVDIILFMNFLLILISVFLNALAQILMKGGMGKIGDVGLDNIKNVVLTVFINPLLLCAFFSFAISLLLWLIVLSRVDVSFAFPFNALGYIVVAIAGHFCFGEIITIPKILGIVIICLGVLVMSRG
jgi:drug/metabolite transporter (DMT)-like permease